MYCKQERERISETNKVLKIDSLLSVSVVRSFLQYIPAFRSEERAPLYRFTLQISTTIQNYR
jgi:hypothetical protein